MWGGVNKKTVRRKKGIKASQWPRRICMADGVQVTMVFLGPIKFYLYANCDKTNKQTKTTLVSSK